MFGGWQGGGGIDSPPSGGGYVINRSEENKGGFPRFLSPPIADIVSWEITKTKSQKKKGKKLIFPSKIFSGPALLLPAASISTDFHLFHLWPHPTKKTTCSKK